MGQRLLITRPRAQAEPWVEALRARGVDAHSLPLIDILPPVDRADVHAAWQQLPHTTMVMFVSANAAEQFFAARPAAARWPDGLEAACTGEGTRAALHAAGLGPALIVGPGPGQVAESESVWKALGDRDWRGRRVLVVRGEEGRDWLAEQWRIAGAEVHFVAAYRRALPTWTPSERHLWADAVASPATSCWHFSSAQSVHHLRNLAPAAPWRGSQAWATHPRIVQAARQVGFERVSEVSSGWSALLEAWLAQGLPRCDTYNLERDP